MFQMENELGQFRIWKRQDKEQFCKIESEILAQNWVARFCYRKLNLHFYIVMLQSVLNKSYFTRRGVTPTIRTNKRSTHALWPLDTEILGLIHFCINLKTSFWSRSQCSGQCAPEILSLLWYSGSKPGTWWSCFIYFGREGMSSFKNQLIAFSRYLRDP